MPGEPLKPGAIYNSNRFMLRGLLQAARLRRHRPRHRARPARRHARGAARGGRRQRPDPHLAAACRSARRTTSSPPSQAEGALDLWQIAIKPGKPLAFGACAGRRRRDAVHRPAGQPGVQLRHLPAARAAVAAARCRARPTALPAALAAARRLRLAASPTGGANSCACALQRRRRARPVPEPELGRADLDGLGRRPGRQPGRPGHRAGRHGALPALSELICR